MAREGVFGAFERQAPFFHGVDDGLERSYLLGWIRRAHQHCVAARLDRAHRRILVSVSSADGFHFKIIAEDQPFVAKLFLQQAVHERRRQGGRVLLVKRRNQDVRGHDRRDTRGNRRLERDQLDLVESLARMVDQRQLEVRIGARVAMSGKMFTAGGDTRALQRPDDHRPEPRNILGVLRQSAIPNDRVVHVRQHIENGSVVERNADRAELHGQRLGKPLGEPVARRARPPERNHRRPFGERPLQPRHASALLVHADPQRNLRGQLLRFARHIRDLIGGFNVPREEDHAAEIELTRKCAHVGMNAVAIEPDNRKLPDVTAKIAQRHYGES